MKPIAFLAVLAASAIAGHWDIEKVDSADWGAAVDMRWHPDGRLFLCYSDTSGIIRLASEDSVWSYEDLPQWRGPWPGTQGFDIDRLGRIGVSYLSTNYHVWCALKNDTGWADIQTPFIAVGGYSYSTPLVALDTSGAPVLSLGTSSAFLLARMRDTSWVVDTLMTGFEAYNSFLSIALGSMVDGTVWGVFVYYWSQPLCSPYGSVVYSCLAWDSGVSVVSVSGFGYDRRIRCASGCVDQHGVIHSCYGLSGTVSQNGTYLDPTRIDSAVAGRTAVKVDSLGRPQIAYVTSGDTLMFRYLDSGVWHVFDLQTTGLTALSLAIDKNSEPLIAYTTSDGVFLARGVGITGLSEEQRESTPHGSRLTTSVIRNVLLLPRVPRSKPQATSWLLDAAGRKVLDLHPGPNDVSRLSPGVYFVREAQAQAQAKSIRKVIVTR